MTSDGELLVREHPETERLIEEARSRGYDVEIPSLPNNLSQMPVSETLAVFDRDIDEKVGELSVEFTFSIKKGMHGRYIDCTVGHAELQLPEES